MKQGQFSALHQQSIKLTLTRIPFYNDCLWEFKELVCKLFAYDRLRPMNRRRGGGGDWQQVQGKFIKSSICRQNKTHKILIFRTILGIGLNQMEIMDFVNIIKQTVTRLKHWWRRLFDHRQDFFIVCFTLYILGKYKYYYKVLNLFLLICNVSIRKIR